MKQSKNENGFTLIEVLIAAVIISFGMLAMGTFLGNYMNKNTHNERVTMATTYAQEQIETLRTLALATDLTAADGATETLPGSGGTYTRTSVVDDTSNPHTITVTVTWTDTGSGQVVLATLVNDDA